MFSRWMNGLLGLALVSCLITFAPVPSFAACQTSGEGSFSSGFEISGNVVTLCGKAIEVQPARSAVVVTTIQPIPVAPIKPIALKPVAPKPVAPKPMPKPAPIVSKPISKVQPVVQIKPPVVLKIIMVDRYVPPPPKVVVPIPVKPVPKPTPTPTPRKPTPVPTAPAPKLATIVTVVTTPGVTTVDTGSVSFTPVAMSASVSDASLRVGQTATFSADPFTHFRTGTILGRAAEVSFTPTSVSWSFSDGSEARGSTVAHSFANSGSKTATASVGYSVAYRFVAGGGWITQGSIDMSATVQIMVSASGAVAPPTLTPVSPPKKVVFLVARNCLGNAGAIGCLSG
jgi:hypothetical protein